MANHFQILLLFVACIAPSLAANWCYGNFTVSNATQAREVRGNCEVIKGNLFIDTNASASINLDGLEEVYGSVTYQIPKGLNQTAFSCTTPTPINISSSTLRYVNGTMSLSELHCLEKIILPNLKTVNGSVYFWGLNLTHVDITNLESVESLRVSGLDFNELKLIGLKNFTAPSGGFVYVSGGLENLDALYKNPLDPGESGPPPYEESTKAKIHRWNTPNVRHLTFGWKRVNELLLGVSDLNVTFGGPSSETLEIQELLIDYGVTKLERGSQLKTFTVDNFKASGMRMRELRVPFDHVNHMRISSGPLLESLEFPVAVENWKNATIVIQSVPKLTLDSTEKDGNTTWHWPKGDIYNLTLSTNITTEFFSSFINGTTRVTGDFRIRDFSGSLDCSIFEEIKNRLPARGYRCYSSSSIGSKSRVSWIYAAVLVLGTAVIIS